MTVMMQFREHSTSLYAKLSSDPRVTMGLSKLGVEAKKSRSMRARMGLQLAKVSDVRVEPESSTWHQAFQWSAALVNSSPDEGTPDDVRLLRETAERIEMDVIHEHADDLESTLRGDALLDVVEPQKDILPAPRGLGLCARWYEIHHVEIEARYAGSVLAIGWNGIVGAQPTRRAICEQIDKLVKVHGPFCFQLADLSMKLPSGRDMRDHEAVKLLESVLPKLHPDLRRRLRDALNEDAAPGVGRDPTNRLSLVVVLGTSEVEPPELDIEQREGETRDEYRKRLVTAQAAQLRDAFGPVLRKIDETGVERIGGDHLQTIVIRGTPRQLLRALALRDVAHADLGDRKMMLIGEKPRFAEAVSPLPPLARG